MTSAGTEAKCHQASGMAQGKVLVIGEHAVVYGRQAFVLPLPAVSARAVVTRRPGGITFSCSRWTGELQAESQAPAGLAGPVAAIFASLGHVQGHGEGVDIVLSSTVPEGRGLGSSAAVATALVRGISGAFGHTLGEGEELALVHIAEVHAHGTPSGVDGAAVVAGAPLSFRRQGPVRRLVTGGDFFIVVADSGVARDTHAAVNAVRAAASQDPTGTEAAFDQLGWLAEAAAAAWEIGDLASLGMCLDVAHGLLTGLNVSTDSLDRLVSAARSAGALGAKLTGAGLGGCVMALAPNEAIAASVAASLTEAGAPMVWIQPYAAEQL